MRLYAVMLTTALINNGLPFLGKSCRDVGLTSHQLHEAQIGGAVRRILDRVYVDARAPDTRNLRINSMKIIAPPHAVVADDWASWVFGVDTFAPSRRHSLTPTLVVPHGRSRTRIDGLDCRQALLNDNEIIEIDGLKITSPARTTSDFLRKKWRPHALSAADSMAHAGLVTPDEVRGFVGRLAGFPGIRQARNLARLIEERTESPGESWTRLRIIDAGFAAPKPQLELLDRDGNLRFLDLSYPELKLAVEYDGREFHTAVLDQNHDDGRRRLVKALGFRILVVMYEDIFGDDASFEHELGGYLGIVPLPRRW